MRGSILAATAALGMMGISSVATGQTAAEVGDVDSFGRSVKYLGVFQTPSVMVRADCSQVQAPARCITSTDPGTQVDFNETGLGTMRLPGWSTRSLICFSMTARTAYFLRNTRPGDIYGSFAGRAVLELENSVLNDPSLIDPYTGAPLNGKIVITLSTSGGTDLLKPGEVKTRSASESRDCIGGLINRRMLVDAYGLSSLQASQFFQRPITLRFGSAGSGFGVETGDYWYGIRLFGD